jgi:hypothetical protein
MDIFMGNKPVFFLCLVLIGFTHILYAAEDAAVIRGKKEYLNNLKKYREQLTPEELKMARSDVNIWMSPEGYHGKWPDE